MRGKTNDKIVQHGHDKLSTFGLCADVSEAQLRGVLRQLIATGALQVDAAAYNTLVLTDGSRAVLKGETPVRLRLSVSAPSARAPRRERSAKTAAAAATLDSASQARFAALKAWRAEVAREHNLPAYVIFHDATLAAIAERAPSSLDDLQGITGIGGKKLEAYGVEVLRVSAAA